jgi:hypothetical protein
MSQYVKVKLQVLACGQSILAMMGSYLFEVLPVEPVKCISNSLAADGYFLHALWLDS